MAGSVTIHEFDALVAGSACGSWVHGACTVSDSVFQWLEAECLRASAAGEANWLRFAQHRGRRALQVMSYVGVIRTPAGFQIEVLPKIGKANASGHAATRQLLIRMLSCLPGFRHIATESASLRAARMPLLEVFISEFLEAASVVLKRGLRSTYVVHEENLGALRGKLVVSRHLTQNLVRADRFYTEHDEFTTDRPENRLLKTALHQLASISSTSSNQQLARELLFAMGDVPVSTRIAEDFRRVHLDRGMGAYHVALAWAKLVLDHMSPLTAMGKHEATSLLFPMDALFEAFVAVHLPRQLDDALTLRAQTSTRHLVRHRGENWFRLKPDLLVQHAGKNLAVLDTKWKLLDTLKANGTDKYGLGQADFYQLQAYGQSYLDGRGDVILVFPKTQAFDTPLPVFEFANCEALRLWVVPFCLETRRLTVHEGCALRSWLEFS